MIQLLLLAMTFNFVGGAYQSASLRANAQTSVNLYPEKDESGSGKSAAQLVGTPGLSIFGTLPTSPVRGVWIGEGRTFAVAGSKLYEVFSNGTYALQGDVGNDGKPVYIVANGGQLAIASAGYLYIATGTTIVQLNYAGHAGTASCPNSGSPIWGVFFYLDWVSGDAFDSSMVGKSITYDAVVATVFAVDEDLQRMVIAHLDGGGVPVAFPVSPIAGPAAFTIPGETAPASSIAFLDGYGIISRPVSRQFSISGLNDFTSWDPLDVASKEGYPDPIARVFTDHQDLWLIGTQTSEVWRNSGRTSTDANGNLVAEFPFERVPGSVFGFGTPAPASVAKLGPSGFAMLAGNTDNSPLAYYIQGYQPTRISTHALESIWAGYSTVSDAVAYSYEQAGHYFYVISFPTADATWAYDLTEKLWHRRGYWDGTTLHRALGAFHGFCFGKHLLGAHDSGAIYAASLDTYDDAGQPIYRERAAPHISKENKRIFFPRFTLDVETGEIADPQFTLQWSDDGGHTWSNPRTLTGGAIGKFATRLIARRLGFSRDRVFRVSSTAAMRHVWIDAFIEAQAGAE